MVYVKAIWHPRTVKWGPNTYSLSLGGHTEIFSGPMSDKHTIAFKRLPKESVNPVGHVHAETAAAASATFSNLSEKLKDMISLPAQKDVYSLEEKHANGGSEFTWRHFPQNGCIRGTAESVRRLEHISVNAALMSDA